MERVIFLYEKDSTDVFAFFPDMIEYDNFYNSYAHIGQHSCCALDYAKECQEAKVSDILPLYQELTQIGYDIKTTSKNAFFWL
jgi:hypothetical protein